MPCLPIQYTHTRRLKTDAFLFNTQTHADRVVAILLQPGNVGNLVVTGSANGEMKFCDLRNSGKPFHNANAFGLRGGGLGGAAAGGEHGVGGDEWGRRSSGGSRDQGSTTFAGPPSGGGRASYSGTGTPAQSRATNAPTSGQTTHENNKALTGLVAHSNARLIACASTERVVRLWDLEGNPTAVVVRAFPIPTHSASLIAHTRLTFLFTISETARRERRTDVFAFSPEPDLAGGRLERRRRERVFRGGAMSLSTLLPMRIVTGAGHYII